MAQVVIADRMKKRALVVALALAVPLLVSFVGFGVWAELRLSALEGAIQAAITALHASYPTLPIVVSVARHERPGHVRRGR
jgi:hypothetical protein